MKYVFAILALVLSDSGITQGFMDFLPESIRNSWSSDSTQGKSSKEMEPWFLDVSYFRFSRIISDSTDSSVHLLAVDYDLSLGSPSAHWLIYEPHRIVLRVQWSLNGLVGLPVERKYPLTFIKIPDHHNRPVFISDGETEERVEMDLQLSELTVHRFLYPNHDPGIPFVDPFSNFDNEDVPPNNPAIEK